MDFQVGFDGFDDGVGAAAAELAWCLVNLSVCCLQFQPQPQLDAWQKDQHLKVLTGRYTYSSANLDMIFPNRIPIIHSIKRRHLINSHRWHLKNPRHLIHHTQTSESGLSLSKVEERHDGSLFVLGRVAGEDLFDDGLVLGGELEGDGGVVFGCVAVLGPLLVGAQL